MLFIPRVKGKSLSVRLWKGAAGDDTPVVPPEPTAADTRVWWSDDENDYSDIPIIGELTYDSLSVDGHIYSDAVKVEIGSSVTSIGDAAFQMGNLTEVSIPNSVTAINYCAFHECDSLTRVTIPDSVTRLGVASFSGCDALETVIIGKGLAEIEDGNPFEKCDCINEFVVSEENAHYKSIDGMLFSKDGKTLVAGINGDVEIPEATETIGNAAFSGYVGLTSVLIPKSVSRMEGFAFYECSGLWTISVDPENTHYKSVNGLLLSKDGKTLIRGVNGDVTIPNSVTNIGENAFFYCTNLTSVTIPDGVTSIGEDAFNYCSGLTSVTIPDSVTSIGKDAFDSYIRSAVFIGYTLSEVPEIPD